MKICVLLPDYSTSSVDYQHYDPPRDLAALLPQYQVDTVFLNKLTTYKQLKALSRKGYDIFVNLCEGYLEWEVPSIDVIYTLELLNLPFTGPTTLLYDPPKELMKYVAFCEGVKTPAYMVAKTTDHMDQSMEKLRFPLFVKPAKAGDSLGIDEQSLVRDKLELQQKMASIIEEYDELLIEEYIAGREFTVLLMANADGKTSTVLQPVEFIFPEGKQFKTYALKTSELHVDANVPVKDEKLSSRLKDAAQRIFRSFNGVGYARLDFRMDEQGELYFLEINFTCSVFYKDGYEGSADYILQYDGIGQQRFLEHIITEGIERHKRTQQKYRVKGDAIAGYGIYANRDIARGETIFHGEERAQRIVTKRFVDAHWSEAEKENFRRYAYPISQEVFILWDNDPSKWAPQNHSCDANTGYEGLNVVALKDIQQGEELTLDYVSFLDEQAEPFTCHCRSSNCRGTVSGRPGNRVQ